MHECARWSVAPPAMQTALVEVHDNRRKSSVDTSVSSHSMYAVVDPSTGDVVKEYPTATDAQMEHALASASRAYRDWSNNSTVEERAALIRRVAELHTERKDQLAEIIQREMGK